MTKQIKTAVNMYSDTGRYFQKLPPRKQREAEKLAKHFSDVQRVFLWTKGETDEHRTA